MTSLPVVCTIAFVILLPPASIAAELEWEVVNRFPVFKDRDDFKNIAATWKQGENAEEFLSAQSAVSLRELLPIQKTFWNPSTGTYDKAGFFSSEHKIQLTYTGSDASGPCTWFVNDQELKTGSCREGYSTPVAEDKVFSIAVKHSGTITRLNNQQIASDLIIGIGDSFASGEGNPDHAVTFSKDPELTDVHGLSWFRTGEHGNGHFVAQAEWWDHACHRSMLSWQSLFALERAVNSPHRVVRFASFACSGAEIYDGFFRAQLNPPGHDAIGVTSSVSDGVDEYRKKTGKLQTGGKLQYEPYHGKTPKLLKSQLNAVIDLLCLEKIDGSQTKAVNMPAFLEGHGSSLHFGKYEHSICKGGLRTASHVLLSFAGNDFSFGGVVAWAMMPDTVRRNPLLMLPRLLGLNAARSIAVVDPTDAGNDVARFMAPLYRELNRALEEILGVAPQNVFALMYPDPLPVDDYEGCLDRLRGGNQALGEVARSKHLPGWLFGVRKDQVAHVREKFISPLRNYQCAEIDANGWNLIDSQTGFSTNRTYKSLCAVGPECTPNDCPDRDRFAWQQLDEADTSPLLRSTLDWEPYDSKRYRGLRTANDAVMTQMRLPADENLEWMTGLAHPTAAVHATIATHLAACESNRDECVAVKSP